MKDSDLRILKKIVSEIEYLEKLLDEIDLDAFLADETIERASSMTTINVGELAKRLSEEFYTEHPGTELRFAAKTRDVYALAISLFRSRRFIRLRLRTILV